MAAMDRAADETSPLVGARTSDDADVDSITFVNGSGSITGTEDSPERPETKSSWYLFLLTLSIGGLQVVWSVELSSGSPYLLSLGMSKALLAFVWIAGPITGTLVQPYIGIRSDNCRISWGKRKPFMVVGGAVTIATLLALAWVKEAVGGIFAVFGGDSKSEGAKITVIVVATMIMWCLDFAINTVQAGIRCFIVDNAPAHQQESANAWASRMTGVGNIIGYILGYINLPKLFPFLGHTRFQILCALSSISLVVTLLISCSYIQERDPRLDGPPPSGSMGVVGFFKQVFKSIKHLPPQATKVCEVQIAAWIAWFPFLFYATTYIGQLYVNPIFDKHPDLSDSDIDKAWEKATRVGTLALLIYALVSFIANIALPVFVVPTYKPVISDDISETGIRHEAEPCLRVERQSSTDIEVGLVSELHPEVFRGKARRSAKRKAWLSKLQIPGLTLRRTWLLSQMLFALCMFSTFFISSVAAATIVVGLIGISWALTLWAPFALISAEVATLQEERRVRRRRSEMVTFDEQASARRDRGANENENEGETGSSRSPKAAEDEDLAQAGIVLGLHNVAVSSPQVLSSLICSAIFKAFQKPRGEPYDDSVGWVLRFGGCAALLAAWLTSRLSEGTTGKRQK
ncbi:putative sucrose transporter [Aspergillus mulundensis]|uniref:Putative Sucrose transporter n=1 Tax=Aspergillus mulundensis TaxID=1810919 RepID=A0A3D8RXK4_9EURO|nr:putative Sucrose transporter [Aspergillus mulundensis]RDW78792.1 putative Sucrose transporter [Aspergillus mulundensis]